jgi:hypothetical protein
MSKRYMPNISSLSYPFPINYFLFLKLKFNLKILKILSFISIGIILISSLVLYIFQINSVIQKTYLLRNYEKELSVLAENNKNLEISLSQTNNLENIQSLIRDLNYVKIGEIRYIQVMEPQVVAK